MKGKEERKAVSLPAELYGRTGERAKTTGFGSVDEYVAFVLEEVLRDEEQEEKTYTKEDEAEVKRRLKDLGYL